MYEEFTEELRQLGEIYNKTKTLVLWSEQVDPQSRSNLQIFKELRDAFDHWMRVVVRVNTPTNDPSEDLKYCKTNLDKCKGHVYRAMFDALDGVALSLREGIKRNLEGYTSDVISTVMPDYWRMKEEIQTLEEELAQLRSQKDIGEDFKFEAVADDYLIRLNSLKNWDKRILSLGKLLVERKREVEKMTEVMQRDQRFVGVRIPLYAAVVGAVVSAALSFWFAKYFF